MLGVCPHLSSGLPVLEARRHMSHHPVAAHRTGGHGTLLAACPCQPGVAAAPSRLSDLSKLRYIVDIDTRKLFFSAHIKPHIDNASVVWNGCSDVLKKRLNSLHRRVVKLIFPDTTLTTDQKLKERKIMNLQKQLEYKGLFMCRVLNNEAP